MTKITVSINQTAIQLTAKPEQSVLEVLLEHGIPIRQACTNGVCGICITPLLEGQISYGQRQARGLNAKELQAGYFLPCIAHCESDIHIGKPKVALR